VRQRTAGRHSSRTAAIFSFWLPRVRSRLRARSTRSISLRSSPTNEDWSFRDTRTFRTPRAISSTRKRESCWRNRSIPPAAV
jgi:hypothetical protein